MRLIVFRLLLSVGIGLFLSGKAQSQNVFKEGVLTYNVSIERTQTPADGEKQPTSGNITGTFTITVKGTKVKKELKLNTGFVNTIISVHPDSPSYSLKKVQEKKYAIQLSSADMRLQNERFENFTTKENKSTDAVKSFKTNKMRVSYRDGNSSLLHYSSEWILENVTVFERFPGFPNIPLKWDLENEDGTIVHLIVESIVPGPIDDGSFVIPRDFKIISNNEYRQLSR